jgi:hypothetical protein
MANCCLLFSQINLGGLSMVLTMKHWFAILVSQECLLFEPEVFGDDPPMLLLIRFSRFNVHTTGGVAVCREALWR